MEKVKYVTYKVLIAKECATSVFDDMITIPENKPYSEIPAFISAYVRTQLENIMLNEKERAEIHNDKKTYEQGLIDAWEAARIIVLSQKDGGLSVEAVKKIFGLPFSEVILKDFDAAEAIAKIKAYEEKEAEIKVGDVVISDNDQIIVTYTKGGNIIGITEDGFARICIAKDIEKTNRHFPQVEELLKAMKEG